MGLDMYMGTLPAASTYSFDELAQYERKLLEDATVLPDDLRDVAKKKYTMLNYYTLTNELAYWRKANNLHDWFVHHVQDGVDDCEMYEVSKEHLEDLYERSGELLAQLLSIDIMDVGNLLDDEPTIFTGIKEYDDTKIQVLYDLRQTVWRILEQTDFENEYVYYRASW